MGKKLRTWMFLTAGGALALVIGARRFAEAVTLDPDNQ